jgi:hypothetical protein
MKGFSSKTLCNNIKRIREKWNFKQTVITKFLQELNIIDKQGAGFKESIVSLLHG